MYKKVRDELSPPKSCVEALSFGTTSCGHIWNLCLFKCNQIKLKSLGWILTQCNECFYKKRGDGADIWREEHMNTQVQDD